MRLIRVIRKVVALLDRWLPTRRPPKEPPRSLTPREDRIDVRYVAQLARLQLTDEEQRTFQAQLEQILEYIHAIRQVDVTGIEATAHATRVQNVFRDDGVRPGLERDRVLANAPEHSGDQFRVPKIVE